MYSGISKTLYLVKFLFNILLINCDTNEPQKKNPPRRHFLFHFSEDGRPLCEYINFAVETCEWSHIVGIDDERNKLYNKCMSWIQCLVHCQTENSFGKNLFDIGIFSTSPVSWLPWHNTIIFYLVCSYFVKNITRQALGGKIRQRTAEKNSKVK